MTVAQKINMAVAYKGSKLFYIIAYLQGAAVPEETPNAETLEAMAELESGGGHKFSSTTEQLFTELMEG
jgi:hypothetical protein